MSDKIFDYWDFFASEARRADSPLYERLAAGVKDSEELRAFAAQAKPGQPLANILFGAVHFLLLRGVEHPLRRFYPNLNNGKRVEGEDPYPHFVDFVAVHRDALLPLIESKVTNTNEVGRCASLHPAFRVVAKEAGEPINMIEIGPSAGLNLNWDLYGVRYHRDSEVFELPISNAALTLECELRGPNNPPLGSNPKVASRVGLELNPVNLDDPDQHDWLRALVWPDTHGRFERLEAALKIYAQNKPRIVAGSALDLLTDVLRAVPEDQPVCVYHSCVIYQFTREMREAFEAMLTVAGLRRPVWRVSIESRLRQDDAIDIIRYHDGVRDQRTVAHCHPHGRWLGWLE